MTWWLRTHRVWWALLVQVPVAVAVGLIGDQIESLRLLGGYVLLPVGLLVALLGLVPAGLVLRQHDYLEATSQRGLRWRHVAAALLVLSPVVLGAFWGGAGLVVLRGLMVLFGVMCAVSVLLPPTAIALASLLALMLAGAGTEGDVSAWWDPLGNHSPEGHWWVATGALLVGSGLYLWRARR